MSQQSDAKKSQEYRVEQPRCATCKHFRSDLVPINHPLDRNKECVEAGRAEPDFQEAWVNGEKAVIDVAE